MKCGLILGALVLGTLPTTLPAQSCRERPVFRLLDFWIGDWDVFVGTQLVGRNRIERVLDGCAVMEYWTDANGSEGRSLFYYSPLQGAWAQIWVTARPGAVKEKIVVGGAPPGAVRFQGTVAIPGGGTQLDRTTLTPNDDGTVRQLIEISDDDGASWRVTFDATYVRRSSR